MRPQDHLAIFPCVCAEQVGIDSGDLLELYTSFLSGDERERIHAFALLYEGNLVSATALSPMRTADAHTFTPALPLAVAVGMAAKEGLLSEQEALALCPDCLTKADLLHLWKTLERICGMTPDRYLQDKLFAPLQIPTPSFATDAQGELVCHMPLATLLALGEICRVGMWLKKEMLCAAFASALRQKTSYFEAPFGQMCLVDGAAVAVLFGGVDEERTDAWREKIQQAMQGGRALPPSSKADLLAHVARGMAMPESYGTVPATAVLYEEKTFALTVEMPIRPQKTAEASALFPLQDLSFGSAETRTIGTLSLLLRGGSVCVSVATPKGASCMIETGFFEPCRTTHTCLPFMPDSPFADGYTVGATAVFLAPDCLLCTWHIIGTPTLVKVRIDLHESCATLYVLHQEQKADDFPKEASTWI